MEKQREKSHFLWFLPLLGEAVGQQLGQGDGLDGAVFSYQVDDKIVPAEFPHHLAADAAGREGAGDDAVLSAADGYGGEVPMAVVPSAQSSAAPTL